MASVHLRRRALFSGLRGGIASGLHLGLASGTRASAIGLTLSLVACGSDSRPPTQPPPDTVAPSVTIVFPVDSIDEFLRPATRYEETGNGLIDVRVTWSDAGDGVDPSTARIEVLGEIAGSSGSGDNLTAVWTQVELDANGLAFEETIADLVRQGAPRLVVSVADSAGNRGADTLQMHVRYGDYHRSIHLLDEPGAPTLDVAVCEDDERLYLARAFAITVIEANTFELIGTFPEVLAEPPARVLCVPGDPMLYATVRVNRFNRTTLRWESEVPGTFFTDGIIQSRLDPAIIWAGEFGRGIPERVDRVAGMRLGNPAEPLFPVSAFSDDFVFAIVPLDGDRKLYYSRAREGGVVVGDPATGEQLAHVDLEPDQAGPGLTDNMVASADDRFVYAALQGFENGLVEISTDTDQATRLIDSFGGFGIDVAINPAGNRLWLTTQDQDPARPSASLLIDPGRWEVVGTFPRPVPPGAQTRWVLAATFHPNGKLLYQARDDDIDVYLIR